MRLAILIAAGLTAISTAAWGANTYFTNPGFENGNLIGWNLSSTDYNCLVDRRLSTIPGCPDDPSVGNRVESRYVRTGNYGMMLGSYNELGPDTLTQTVNLTITGQYRVDFSLRERDYYPQTPENSFEVVWGTDLDNLISIYLRTDQSSNNWQNLSARFSITTPGTYVVGFRFNNMWGDWALDNTGLVKNPEPGTLAMLAAPLAWLAWKRRRAFKRTARATGS
jgi:hypothetical protein